MVRITPVVDVPLLLVEGELKVLVAADLHIGLEHDLWLGGASVPSQTEKLFSRLRSHLKKIGPDRLVLLGDVKHNVPLTSFQEKNEVPAFIEGLSALVEVDLVPGNHDVGLKDLVPSDVKIAPSAGYILDGVGYFHGHAWPHPDLFRADALVSSHIHPALRLRDPLGSSTPQRVWVRTPLRDDAVREHYRRDLEVPEMIIVPSFNPLCGGYPLDVAGKEERGPLLKMADLDRARIYLLDGTGLGRLGRIRKAYGNRKRLYSAKEK
ncbi:MAG: metallophosphoesterase [Euryarchaeota archaeon]|nr:metallophosphoesterase [Euryarchaeota archaeon]